MWRRSDSILVSLALGVLRREAFRAKGVPLAVLEVRLALRVVALFLPRRAGLDAYWRAILVENPHPWETARPALGGIEDALAKAGWRLPAEHEPEEGWAMCNRFRMTARDAEVAARYGVHPPYLPDESSPAGDLFPKRPALIVRKRYVHGVERACDALQWGWPRTGRGAKGQPIETRVTNIRNLESPLWRSALADPARRCLVPVTAFSEYGPGEKGKRPLYWFDVPSRPLFSFAGLWRPTERGEGVFAFLTCEPNSLVAPIHPKAMPVILDDEGEERWLAGELGELVAPFPAQLMAVALGDLPDDSH